MVLALVFGVYFFSGGLKFGALTPTGPQHRQVEAFIQGITFGTRNQSQFDNAGKFTLGSSGTALTNIIATTCTGIVYASLGATTTAPIDCAVTGALTTAKAVILELPSGQPAAGIVRNLIVTGGHASSTAGYVTANITNLTGTATTSYAQATTSMKVLVIQ